MFSIDIKSIPRQVWAHLSGEFILIKKAPVLCLVCTVFGALVSQYHFKDRMEIRQYALNTLEKKVELSQERLMFQQEQYLTEVKAQAKDICE